MSNAELAGPWEAPEAPPELSDLGTNTVQGLRDGMKWWFELNGEKTVCWEKLDQCLTTLPCFQRGAGWALKATDSPPENAGKSNSDSCACGCYVSRVKPAESCYVHSARASITYAEQTKQPLPELTSLMSRAWAKSPAEPAFHCIDLHATEGLIKMYCHFDRQVKWMVENVGMPPGYERLAEVLGPEKDAPLVSLLGFDLVNNTMNSYVTFMGDKGKAEYERIFRACGDLVSAKLPEDVSSHFTDDMLDMVLTYSFATHSWTRLGTYMCYDLSAPDLSASGCSAHVEKIFQECKRRLTPDAPDPIQGLLPFNHFMVGHTYSRNGKSYAKYEPVQQLCHDMGWKFLCQSAETEIANATK